MSGQFSLVAIDEFRHEGELLFQQVKPITLWSSLSCLTFHFWDEQSRKLVGYAHVRQIRRQQRQQ